MTTIDKAHERRATRDRDLFDRIAQAYCRKDLLPAHRDARKLRLLQTIRFSNLSRDARILEVGCGAGFAASYLTGHYADYVGIDYSEELIRYAVEVNGADNAQFETVSADDYEPEEQFDLIFMIGVLHHLPDPLKTLGRLSKCLRPGGCVAVNEPQSGNPIIQIARRVRKKVDSSYSEDQDEYSAQELLEMFQTANLRDIHIHPQGVLSTPFAEVSMPAQWLVRPACAVACVVDRMLESTVPALLSRLSWNLVAIGSNPAGR